MELYNKKFLVAGLGMSGAAAARFLKNRGASVTVTDMAEEQNLLVYAPMMREMGISLELGQHRIETFEDADAIVLSPGVPHFIAPVKAAIAKGIPVIGEIELAFRFIAEPIVAVTGTNGKTTVTTLLGKMLENSGFKVFVGGNIGNPLIAYVDRGDKADRIVLEISSFQLDTIDTFRPRVGVLLNITDDHLDRYPDFMAYAKSKARIFENQTEDDVAVLNLADPAVREVTQHIISRKTGFGVRGSGFGENFPSPLTSDLGPLTSHLLIGRHNEDNVSAACLAAIAAGATKEGIQSALDNFKGLPHRIEYVAEIAGVRYFDDSKGTNTDAVIKALECFDFPVILIMGGRGKGGAEGNGFHVLKESVSRKVKHLIVMGETKEELKAVLGKSVFTTTADSMEDAVYQAHRAAVSGDTVLLSPACSSFDMYRSYAERGQRFCEAVREIKK